MSELRLFIPMIFVLLSLYTSTYYLKKNALELLAPLLISISLMIFIFSLFGLFQFAVYLVIVLAVLGFSFTLYKVRLKNSYFFQLNTLFVFILFIFLMIWNKERYFYQWDEFMHWGLMVKEMFRLHDLYSIPASHLIVHKDYPPIIPILQTFWLNLSRIYSEPQIYQILQLLGFSMMLSFIAKKKMNILSFLFIFGLFIIYQGFFDLGDAKFFLTIYLDPILGIAFAYFLFLIFNNDDSLWSKFQIIIAGSFLVLIKEMGLFLLGLGFIVWFVIELNKGFKKEKIRHYLIIWSIPILFIMSWKIYFSQFDYVGQFHLTSFSIQSFIEIVQGSGGALWQQQAYTNYINSLASLYLLRKPFELNHFGMNLVFILLSILISFVMGENNKNKWLKSSIVLVLLSNVYAFVMLVLYMYSFGEVEGPKLASNLRYMSTFWYSIGTLFIMVWLSQLKDNKRIIYHSTIWLLVVILFFNNEQNYVRIQSDHTYDNFEMYFTYDTSRLRTETEVDSSVFLITQGLLGNYMNYFRYLVNDRYFNSSGFNIASDSKYEYWDYTDEAFMDAVKGYDYIYIYIMDDEFYERFYDIMPDNFYKENHQLLKIIHMDNQVKFEVLLPN